MNSQPKPTTTIAALRRQAEHHAGRLVQLQASTEALEARVAAVREGRSRRPAPATDPVSVFHERVHALCLSEGVEYGVGYMRLKRDEPALYSAYAAERGVGGLARRV